MFELFLTYVLGALVGGTLLALWVRRSIWPHHGVQHLAERSEVRGAPVRRVPN